MVHYRKIETEMAIYLWGVTIKIPLYILVLDNFYGVKPVPMKDLWFTHLLNFLKNYNPELVGRSPSRLLKWHMNENSVLHVIQ